MKTGKTNFQRLNIVAGQLEAARRMMADPDRDCFALLLQLKAARSGLSAVMERLVGEEFDRCLLKPERQRKEKMEQIFKEIIKK